MERGGGNIVRWGEGGEKGVRGCSWWCRHSEGVRCWDSMGQREGRDEREKVILRVSRANAFLIPSIPAARSKSMQRLQGYGVEIRVDKLIRDRLPYHIRYEPLHLAHIPQDVRICVANL